MKRYRKFSILFALIFIVQLLVSYTENSYLAAFIRPFIIFSLLILFYVSTRLKGRFHKRIFTGLILALAGAVLLVYATRDESYLLYALTAILLCSIFYTRAFYLDFQSAPELDKKGARIAISLCAILAVAFYFFLRPHLGIMKLPVMICMLISSMMIMMASFRNQRVNTTSFKLILFGTIFFFLSGSILALNKFVQQIDHASTWIMASYTIAQYLITIGAAERKLIHNS